MFRHILIIAIMGMMLTGLAGCISGRPAPDTYTDSNGKKSLIETDAEQCKRVCNDTYARCMDSRDARTNSGINGPTGLYGASGECRSDLSACMNECK